MSQVVKIELVVNGQPRQVIISAYAQMAAKRQFGLQAVKEGDPEPTLYAAWVELEGPRPKNEDPSVFDAWLSTVTAYSAVNGAADDIDDEDPTPAESSGSLLVSPPTLA